MTKALRTTALLIFLLFTTSGLAFPQETTLREKIREKVKKRIEDSIEKEAPGNETKETEDSEENTPQEKEKHRKIREISAIFHSFVVPEDTVVEGDVDAIFSSGVINGKVQGDLNIVFGSAALGKHAEIQGDVNGVFSSMSVHRDAVIKGAQNLVFSSGAKKGMGKFPGLNKFKHVFPLLGVITLSWKILLSFGYLILALLVYLFVPRHLETMSEAMDKNLQKIFLTGIVSILLIIPVGILLIVSVIGLLLLPVYIPLVLLAIIFGKVSVGYFLGNRLSKSIAMNLPPVAFLILGMAFVQVSWFIPVFGALLGLFIITIGLGSTVATKFGTKKL